MKKFIMIILVVLTAGFASAQGPKGKHKGHVHKKHPHEKVVHAEHKSHGKAFSGKGHGPAKMKPAKPYPVRKPAPARKPVPVRKVK